MLKYCTKSYREQDRKTYYTNIFSSEKSVRICISSGEKIYKIDVSEALSNEETLYVGWLEQNGNIDFIFPNLILLEVCFPYGTKPEIKRGNGKIVKVKIKEIS